MAPPAAVLWDMDGTLVDSEKLWDRVLHESAERLGGRLSPATRERMVGCNAAVTVDLLLAEVGIPATGQARADADAWLTGRMTELFRESLPWCEGAAEALHLVRAAGIPTALVTSTVRELTEHALDRIGRHFFDVTVCGDEVGGRNKPDPEPYRRAAELLGVDPVRCVAVEDSPIGATSAEAAGCTVLVVPSELPVAPGPRRVPLGSLSAFDLDRLSASGNGHPGAL
ncbi:HAD family phosphatase [Haloechinothrix sp. LS1_15]|uniref:HAD family hydrolase n=1 Tax=Haloechinothrix sp. LS1_15 TaxID=2652248 RepID=UPI00294B9263|nr:HAD family phosphatase [Haloechinothrix sp. LS1_15]